MRHADQVVTRTMLLENVWDYHFDPQTNVVDVHISKLRQKIELGVGRSLLRTVRNAGYMLTADMTRLMRSSALTWSLGYILLGIAALALFAAPLWYAWRVTIEDGRERAPAGRRAAARRVFRARGRRRPHQLTSTSAWACRSPASACCCSPTPPTGRSPGTSRSGRASMPEAPGIYAVMPIARRPARPTTCWCTTALPGGYNLLVGRDLALRAAGDALLVRACGGCGELLSWPA